MHSFEKKNKAVFDLLFTFFSHQEKDTKIPSAHIPHTYTYFANHIDFFFFVLPILQEIMNLSYWFVFGVTPGTILIRAILEQS